MLKLLISLNKRDKSLLLIINRGKKSFLEVFNNSKRILSSLNRKLLDISKLLRIEKMKFKVCMIELPKQKENVRKVLRSIKEELRKLRTNSKKKKRVFKKT